MKKLVCDKCGNEVTDREGIAVMLEGSAAWHASVKSRGMEPRGYFPCRDHRNCAGEMIEFKTKRRGLFQRGGDSD